MATFCVTVQGRGPLDAHRVAWPHRDFLRDRTSSWPARRSPHRGRGPFDAHRLAGRHRGTLFPTVASTPSGLIGSTIQTVVKIVCRVLMMLKTVRGVGYVLALNAPL